MYQASHKTTLQRKGHMACSANLIVTKNHSKLYQLGTLIANRGSPSDNSSMQLILPSYDDNAFHSHLLLKPDTQQLHAMFITAVINTHAPFLSPPPPRVPLPKPESAKQNRNTCWLLTRSDYKTKF